MSRTAADDPPRASGVYERFVRPILFSLNPETAHHLAIRNLRIASRLPFALRLLERFRPPPNPKTVFGLTFPNPVGLAAGFDKNGVAIPAWAALGFGFVEIGTVTAKPQPGNPKPRIFRYPEHQALINRLGFNNDGADVVAARLHRLRESGRWPAIPVGINIGKSKITPIEAARGGLSLFLPAPGAATPITLSSMSARRTRLAFARSRGTMPLSNCSGLFGRKTKPLASRFS